MSTAVPADRDFWLTRDRWEGIIQDVEIWLVRPDPWDHEDGDVTWIAPLGLIDRCKTLHTTLSLVEARQMFGASTPDTERECVRFARGTGG